MAGGAISCLTGPQHLRHSAGEACLAPTEAVCRCSRFSIVTRSEATSSHLFLLAVMCLG